MPGLPFYGLKYLLFLTGLVAFLPILYGQQRPDSSKVLQRVTIIANKKHHSNSEVLPQQALNRQILEELSLESVGDAAKYFSGVLISDYGGIGGLKTVSVRSLGGLNTGLLYDGVPVADAQTGQIDLGRFSSTFVESIQLDLANPPGQLLPARAFSSASVLSIMTGSSRLEEFPEKKWQTGLRQGSFGLWQPFAGISLPAGKNNKLSFHLETISAKGNYPYTIQNGIITQLSTRNNSDIQSLNGEANLVNRFADSSSLQTKIGGYYSDRGLPGTVIFYNNISVQRLWNRDLFIQNRYQKKLGEETSLLISTKYSSTYTRYKDPNFPNNTGGLDDRYQQEEWYGSLALDHHFGKYLYLTLSSDISSTKLSANIPDFANPNRTTHWSLLSGQYVRRLWEVNASILQTNARDKTDISVSATRKNEWTYTVAALWRPTQKSPLRFRTFYKDIFRLPTFNDLYYTFIQNINAKLLPELARQYDFGTSFTQKMHGHFELFDFSVDGYYNAIRNKIIAVPGQNLFIWTMENLGKVQILGLDFNAQWNGNINPRLRWSVRLAYTLQRALDVTNPSSAEYKNEIPYTPDNSGSGIAMLLYRKWTAGYSLIFSGNRYTLGANNPANELSGWDIHDFYLSKSFSVHRVEWQVKVAIDNIFNEQYQVVRYYPMPGRSYKIGIIIKNI